MNRSAVLAGIPALALAALLASGPDPARAEEDARAAMVRVPAGEFTMGVSGAEKDAAPPRRVSLSGFKIDKTEVTVGAYAACVKAGACKAPRDASDSPHCNWNSQRGENHPVNCATWEEARAFCAWRGARLPTEAEWEKAARGASGNPYPWGAKEPDCSLAVMEKPGGSGGCGADGTAPVCSKPAGASPYGLCDMAGNVWEWTSDWYGPEYYAEAPSSNPKGPVKGAMRVLRGGGWQSQEAAYLRASHRFENIPGYAGLDAGFRCAADE